MGTCFVGSAICLVYESYMASFLLMLFYLVAFNLGIGSIVPIYTAEVAIDKAAGLSAGGLFGVSLVWSITTEFMINSSLKASGTFFLFGGISLLGFFYVLIFVKETKGLTDK